MRRKSKEKGCAVYLRTRQLRDGRQSIYLDINNCGRREFRTIGLYLLPETEKGAKALNKKTLAKAEIARAEALIEQKGEAAYKHGILSDDLKNMRIESFVDTYMGECVRASTLKNYHVLIRAAQAHIKLERIGDLTEENQIELRRSLMRSEKYGTYINSIITFISNVIRHAKDFGVPVRLNPSFRKVEAEGRMKGHLNLDELQTLLKMKDSLLDRSTKPFLFSCLTGLRISDIRRLSWGNILNIDGYTKLVMRQLKTSRSIEIPLTSEALSVIGERKRDTDLVFPYVGVSSLLSHDLNALAKVLCPYKHISFHSARHTFAVTMLSLGVDIYTTSKLLGHASVKNTEIYAKITDNKRQEAMSKMHGFLNR